VDSKGRLKKFPPPKQEKRIFDAVGIATDARDLLRL
jgi:hypothetical protein